MMKLVNFLNVVCFLCISNALFAQQKDSNAVRLATREAISSLEKDVPQLIKSSDIPGFTIALIRDGKLVWKHNYGVRNVETNEPVTDETIFEAASLTKVVTSYAVLKLVDQGKISLDTPLNKYLGNNYEVGDDARINQITARRVMTHSAGFPNWRSQDAKFLPIEFDPGAKFSYSGEGFVYLSRVVEQITQTKFEDFVKANVLDPLGMTHSSFIWLEKYKNLHIYRHDMLGNKGWFPDYTGSNAAASLRTTADDYAKFVMAILKGKGLKKSTWNEMLTPQIQVDKEKTPQVWWGLGVGLEVTPKAKYFWHWGDQGDSKCYVTANVDKKDAVVYFANSSNGLTITGEILNEAIGGQHEALVWLDYGKYNPLLKQFYTSIIDKGAPIAIKEYIAQRDGQGQRRLSEGTINRIGYKLLQEKKVEDAIEVFKQNTVDFPQSANTWDSLAEGYMVNGNKEMAIKYYEKSLELNPANGNAVEHIKKLKS